MYIRKLEFFISKENQEVQNNITHDFDAYVFYKKNLVLRFQKMEK